MTVEQMDNIPDIDAIEERRHEEEMAAKDKEFEQNYPYWRDMSDNWPVGRRI